MLTVDNMLNIVGVVLTSISLGLALGLAIGSSKNTKK